MSRSRTFRERIDGVWYATDQSRILSVAGGAQMRQNRDDGRLFLFSTSTAMQAGVAVPCGLFTPLSYAEARDWCAKHGILDQLPARYTMEKAI
jgi:hypothetical protein